MIEPSAIAILESLSDLILTVDRDGRCTYVNRATERLTGVRCEELLGRMVRDILPDMFGRKLENALGRVIAQGVGVCLEAWNLSLDRCFTLNVCPLGGGLLVHGREITDAKCSEAALRRSEERFRRYFELGLIGIAITSPTKGILEVNDEICKMLGYERAELLGKTWAELTYPDDLYTDLGFFNQVLAGEIDGYTLDKRWLRKDGRVIDSTISVKCLRCPDGSVDHFVALLQDITERKWNAEQLRMALDALEVRVVERTRELSAANDELKNEISERKRVETDLLTLKNELAADIEAMTRLHEMSARLLAADGIESLLKEILYATIELQNADFGNVQLYNPHSKALELVAQHGFDQEFLDYFREVRDESTPCGRALRRGERVVIEDVELDALFEPHRAIAARAGFRAAQSTPLFISQGQVLGVLTTHFREPHRPSERQLKLTDLYARLAAQMIERHRVESTLRRSEAYLAMGQRLSHTGSGSWNVRTGEVFLTDETYRICGFEPGSAEPSTELFRSLVHPEDRPSLEQRLAQIAQDRSSYDLSFRALRPDGTIRYIHSVGEPVIDDSGALVEVIGTVVDLTTQKVAEDALHKAQTELAQIARATTMGQLAASIAHEANQPIAAVVSNGEACLSWINRPEPNWDEAQVAVGRMLSEARRASEVIQRVRSLMKRAPVRISGLDVNEIIAEVLVLLQRDIAGHSVSLRTALASGLPSILGDRIHLQQVLVNLITNAIEAIMQNPDSPRIIVISTELRSPNIIFVAIRDSGVGVSGETVGQLFQPFFSKKSDGLGMGLWISRSIIEAHGGTLWATENEDAGATFCFTVPAIT